jgi:hypothetical protein
MPPRPGTFLLPVLISRNISEPLRPLPPAVPLLAPRRHVDGEIVAANIKDSGEKGTGGVELVAFYNYGGETLDPSPKADWVTNGFGTPAFRDVFRAALEAHKDAGLFMDFALGPNQGQGVPASSEDEGLQWDLVCKPRTACFGSYWLIVQL